MEVTVYILRCADGSYYTGLTKQDIEARVWEHNAAIYDRILDAIVRERQIKGWSRVKKQALIAMNYEGLPELSKNRSKRSG